MIPVTLNGNDPEQKRKEILDYFKNCYETFEKLFEMLKDDGVFYKKSEPTRHPMIFYFGHTAVFYINKLILGNIIKERLNSEFESIFAIGVDEMSWDDLNESNYKWPKVSQVREYRAKVKSLVENLILTLPLKLPITQEDPFWIILMGIEHENIHLETSSVLHRQMPLEFIKQIDSFPICKIDKKPVKNEMITISEKTIRLGKEKDHHLYGWDNEYGKEETTTDRFQVSKYLVSNEEFLEFVKDNGYTRLEFWDDEGKEFLKRSNITHPIFWISQKDGSFLYRTIMQIIPLPLSWPVEVNCLEAMAFLKWKSIKDNISYTLPSEEQFYSIYEEVNLQDIPNLKITNFNINLEHFCSPCPVDNFSQNGIYDPIGNVWQWTRTPIYPFDGFKVHPVYDDFSVPTFDNKHNLIKGGSFISCGNEIMKHSRYAFRRHFYQHAGFKYIIGDETIDIKELKCSDEFIDQEKELHLYTDKITNLYNDLLNLLRPFNINDVLEIGSSIGCGTVILSKHYGKITAVDTTARIIQESQDYLKGFKDITNVELWQVDPSNMKPIFKDYDLIVINNIYDRLYCPVTLIQDLKNRVKKGGFVASIYKNDDSLALSFKEHFDLIVEKNTQDKKITIWKLR